MSGQQSVLLKAAGLSTHSNYLGSVPEGSMQEALNVVIDRNGIVEPRRGISQYGNTFGTGLDRTKNIFTYKDVILRHVINKMQYDSDNLGLFSDFTSPLSILEPKTGTRIKAIEANGNFYFVSSMGVRKISAKVQTDLLTAPITLSGGIKAINIATNTNFSSTGFLSANSKVAYRVVFGVKDLTENLILGTPSAREVIYNITTTSCVVDLNFTLPSEVTSTSVFYQIYRTGVFSATAPTEPTDPGDEMYLVLEDNVTSTNITNGYVTVTDITPEDFRKNGTLLYTNPQSGDGIEQSNEKPPFGQDIALYKNYTFLANTKTVQRLNLAFLSISGLTSNTSTISVTNGVTTNTYTFRGTYETYTINFTSTIRADFSNASPATAKYFTLTSSSDERKYCVFFKETSNDQTPVLAGYINIQVDILSGDTLQQIIDKMIIAVNNFTDDFNISNVTTVVTARCSNNGLVTTVPTENITNVSFTITKDGLGTGEDSATNKVFLPRLPIGSENGPSVSQQLEQVAKSLQKIVNLKDTLVYCYYTSGFSDIPGQLLFENRDIVGSAFSIISNAGSQFNPTLPVSTSSGNQVTSNNEIRPNRIHYSKLQQPEAFPLANYIDIGPKDRAINRIIALRDSLFIFKEDGIYRLSGETAPFTVAPFDFSSQVLAPDTAVVLNNQIYALSSQGVIVVTDTGVSVISRPIENLLLKIVKSGSNYKTTAFGISYESDRSYLLYLPTLPTDEVATQCFRYNTFTNTWTRFNTSQTCGLVSFADDKLYLGAGDSNFIEKERKSLTRNDHADRDYLLQVNLNGVTSNTLGLSSVSKVEIGDVLLQTQYLTSSQFDRLLLKLDLDTQVLSRNYYSLLKYVPGQNLRTSLSGLTTKLDADPYINLTNYTSLIQSRTATANLITSSGDETIIQTTAPHNMVVGRYVTITGSDSVPSIDGEYKILSVTSNTLNIGKVIAMGGTTATIQTNVDDFQDIQTCFNLVVDNLNSDSGAFFSDYQKSTNNFEFELVVTSVNKLNNTVTVKDIVPVMFGDITLYKAIKTTVIWNPAFFGDPTLDKQVREGTIFFENSNFSKMTISYASDQSPSYESTEFQGMGNGDWGQFNWGVMNWGGVGAPVPLRTYIPLEKQRCRFINVKFEHSVSFENFSIYGLSLTYRPYSTRTNN
jgi:hypothetical protein